MPGYYADVEAMCQVQHRRKTKILFPFLFYFFHFSTRCFTFAKTMAVRIDSFVPTEHFSIKIISVNLKRKNKMSSAGSDWNFCKNFQFATGGTTWPVPTLRPYIISTKCFKLRMQLPSPSRSKTTPNLAPTQCPSFRSIDRNSLRSRRKRFNRLPTEGRSFRYFFSNKIQK